MSALTTTTDQRAPALTGRDLILHADNLNAMLTVAKFMSQAKQAVPKHLRGNEGGCLAVTMQAMRWNMDPFALSTKTYTVDDQAPVAYEGQAIIAALNNSPLLANRLSYRWEGQWERIVGRFKEVESKTKQDAHGKPKKYIVPDWDYNKDEEGLSVTVSATLVGEAEPRTLTLLMKQVSTRNSPLWTEDPKQQLAYLAARRWGRLHAPDVIMGVYTPDELEDSTPPEKFMGMVEPVEPVKPETPAPKAAPVWPDDKFAAQLPRWTKAIAEGLRTHEQIIDTAKTRGELTAAQVEQIKAVKVLPPLSEEPSGEIVMTYAQVAQKLTDAKTLDKLAEAGSLIATVPDEGQRKELGALYDRRAAELNA